ncbi:MAG: tellurite resistance TerB family protein [Spirochaetales bacterium]|nr:tellurite resistance TerB family protein [Spirochaetales bacterium]
MKESVLEIGGLDLQDQGLYLQGLLQVMISDDTLDPRQRQRIMQFATDRGFEKTYVENTMDSVMGNRFFPRTPPVFNSKETARSFLTEAYALALVDGILHPREKQWLENAARLNGLEPLE